VLIAPIALATEGYSDSRARLFYPQLLDRVRSLVGVQSAGVCWIVPLSGLESSTEVRVPDGADRFLKIAVRVNRNVISPGYFKTLEIPIIGGRDFNDHDNETARAVTIVNQEMARRFWPGADPVGKELELADPRSTLEIVGMVKDGKIKNVREGQLPCFYVPLYQHARREMSLLLRVADDSRQIVDVLRREIQVLDKDLPFTNMKAMKTHLDIALSQERMTLALFSGLGLLALTLASIGIFGIIAFSVTQRTREIGIRMALGAQPGQILRMILKQGVTLIACGLLIGLTAAFILTRLIESMLFEVSPTDLMSYVAALLILVGVSLLACYIPARRATQVDPMVALRYE
jgi:predicted permease